MVCYKYEHDSCVIVTLDCWILAAIARCYHHQDGWSLSKPSLGDTQLLLLIIAVSFLQLSHEAGSCKLERECRDRPSEVKGVLSELESG